MGREAKLTVSDGNQASEARVHLDSEMLAVGPPFRLKLALGEIAACTASADGLTLRADKTALSLKLPAKEAAAWAKAILNPPSLATKLGLKDGMSVARLGPLPPAIGAVLKPFAPAIVKPGAAIAAALTFVALPEGVAAVGLSALAKSLPAKSAVWLIYEKGAALNGDAIIHAARAAKLKDTKVAKISETHTGLRFIPG